MEIIPVSELEMMNIIKTFKLKNSLGLAEISGRIIRLCALEIGNPLSHICNSSLQSGSYPERFKYSVVRPMYKTGGQNYNDKLQASIINDNFLKNFRNCDV